MIGVFFSPQSSHIIVRYGRFQVERTPRCSQQSDISQAESSSGGRSSPDERLRLFSPYMIVHIFWSEGDKRAAGPEYISLCQHQQEQQQLFIRPGAWERRRGGPCLSRTPLRLPAHIVSMMAICLAGVAQQVRVMEAGLTDMNIRIDTFQFFLLPRDAALAGNGGREYK